MTNETGFTAFFARLPLFAARIISLAVMVLGIAVLWSVWFFYEERWRHGELISYYGIQPLLMIGGGTLAFISGCLMMTRSFRGIRLLKLALSIIPLILALRLIILIVRAIGYAVNWIGDHAAEFMDGSILTRIGDINPLGFAPLAIVILIAIIVKIGKKKSSQ